jgi:hypothetical protein
MYVSVVDKNGNPVDDVTTSDLIIREDKITREILSIAPADEPVQIALLIDNSQAAEPVVREYREALPVFINAILDAGPKNRIAVIGVAERPTILADYTSDRSVLLKAVSRIFALPSSGSYLLDGIIETSNGIMKQETSRPPIIVALSTEGPELSDRHYNTVLDPLRASGAIFHLIILGRPVNESADRSIALSRGTSESGGRYDTLMAPTALSGRIKQLAAEITKQHRVTYARPDTLIPPEQVTVAATKPGLTARGLPAIEQRKKNEQ